MPEFRRFQQRLGWNAARVETRATQRATAIAIAPGIDAGGFESVLRGANRGGVSSRSTTDDHDVVIEIAAHDFKPPAACGLDLPNSL